MISLHHKEGAGRSSKLGCAFCFSAKLSELTARLSALSARRLIFSRDTCARIPLLHRDSCPVKAVNVQPKASENYCISIPQPYIPIPQPYIPIVSGARDDRLRGARRLSQGRETIVSRARDDGNLRDANGNQPQRNENVRRRNGPASFLNHCNRIPTSSSKSISIPSFHP